jgi:hypothetical protein
LKQAVHRNDCRNHDERLISVILSELCVSAANKKSSRKFTILQHGSLRIRDSRITKYDSLLKKAGELASQDGISIDQFVSLAVTEKLSGWIGEDDIQKRARKASRKKFDAALAQVPNVPPLDHDKL